MCAQDIQYQPIPVSKSAVDEDDGLYSAIKPRLARLRSCHCPAIVGP